MNTISFVHLEHAGALSDVSDFGVAAANQARSFHRSFPEYAPTPLVRLSGLAKELGIKDLLVKDESQRFGLNAFKVLGGSYAIGCRIAERLGCRISDLSCARLTDKRMRDALGEMTFVTATDGNHGRGVAWTAARLGQRSVVYLPKGSAAERLENIRALGANASITDLNYDDAVRLADENAARFGWALIQDTSWEGYEEIPRRIMQGYTTMALEAAEQLGDIKPTHIFLQAGVGAMSGAVTGFFSSLYGDADRPVITVVEPNAADCIYRTAAANDGRLHFVTGDMPSVMAGLCCGEPCPLGWDILRDHADHFVSVPDSVAECGMRALAYPVGGDTRIISGESGAVTAGLVVELMRGGAPSGLREALGLDESSVILCFSTEGATDRANYIKTVGNILSD